MKLLMISGSLRKGSLNTMLVKEAGRFFGSAQTTLGDIRMPLYDGDAEDASGIPPEAQRLADQIDEADAIVIASPEYNQSIPGGLKNALDWVSRVDGNPWNKKPVALVNAAAGRTGGARANYIVRLALAPFNTDFIQGPEVLIAGASKEFDENGHLTNERYIATLQKLMDALRTAAG